MLAVGVALLWAACSGRRDGAPERVPAPVVRGGDGGSASPPPPQPSYGFGAIVGSPQVTHLPDPGRYAGAYKYSQHIYHTMERDTFSSVSGHAILTLNDDGTVIGCVGRLSGEVHSVSKYASDDGEHHRDERGDHTLWAIAGRWDPQRGAAHVTIDRMSAGTCDARDSHPISLELVCIGLDANAQLPVNALACRVDKGIWLDDLAMLVDKDFPAEPHAFRDDDPKLGPAPWLLLGAHPGLEISADRRDTAPFSVSLTRTKVELVEWNYQPREP